MTTRPELPTISFASSAAWEAWLEEHHGTSDGLWMKLAKKGTGIRSVTLAEAIQGALCYGWVDSQADKFDDERWLLKFTPRRPKSKWSKVNRERVAKLIAEGRMKPAGLHEIERAKSDGRWDAAYDPPSKATVPDDLRLELDGNQRASAFFDTLDGTNRYAILYRIQEARRPETRARRIAKYVTMLSEHKKLYP